VWHALAKGSDVWIEDRVLTPGVRTSDHYVFSTEEVDALLSPYGRPVKPEIVEVGPQRFHRLSADVVYSTAAEWRFAAGQEGWTGINIAGDTVSERGWCFAPGADPNLYSPPVRIDADTIPALEVTIRSPEAGKAQLFFRKDVRLPYSEEQSLSFDIAAGESTYRLDTADLPAWQGTVVGLRLDPIESGSVAPNVDNTVCIRKIVIIR
jgi:hypothetical protein